MMVLIVGFLVSLAWVCFISWVVARFAWREEPPVRRAALTASTSFAIAALLSCISQYWAMSTDIGIAMRIGFDASVFLYYAAAAFVDFLLLRHHFLKRWIDEGEVAEPFR